MQSSDTHFLVSLELEPESIGDFHCRSPSLKDFEVAFFLDSPEIILPVPQDEIPPKKNMQKTLWFRKLEFLSFWVPSHGGYFIGDWIKARTYHKITSILGG